MPLTLGKWANYNDRLMLCWRHKTDSGKLVREQIDNYIAETDHCRGRPLFKIYTNHGFLQGVLRVLQGSANQKTWSIPSRGGSGVGDGGGGGCPGGRTPLFGPRCRLFNIGPKIGPPVDPLFFACRPKMAPPLFKIPGSAPAYIAHLPN